MAFSIKRVVDAVEFEAVEDQVRAGIGHLLLDVAIKLRALRVRRIAGVDQAGDRRRSCRSVLPALRTPGSRLRNHRLRGLAASVARLPFQRCFEGNGQFVGSGEIGLELAAFR